MPEGVRSVDQLVIEINATTEGMRSGLASADQLLSKFGISSGQSLAKVDGALAALGDRVLWFKARLGIVLLAAEAVLNTYRSIATNTAGIAGLDKEQAVAGLDSAVAKLSASVGNTLSGAFSRAEDAGDRFKLKVAQTAEDRGGFTWAGALNEANRSAIGFVDSLRMIVEGMGKLEDRSLDTIASSIATIEGRIREIDHSIQSAGPQPATAGGKFMARLFGQDIEAFRKEREMWEAELVRLRGMSRIRSFAELGQRVGELPKPDPDALAGPSSLVGNTDADHFERVLEGLEREAMAIEGRTRQYTMARDASARLAAEERAMFLVRHHGITVTDEMRASMDAWLDKIQDGVRRVDELERRMAEFKEFSATVTGGLRKEWESWIDGADVSVKRLVQNMLAEFAKLTALRYVFDPLEKGLTGALSGASGGGGLDLSSLFGGFRADGGPVMPGRAYVVGERRPELFVPSVPGTILPSAGAGGVTISMPVTINAQGAYPESVAEIRKAVAGLEQRVPAVAVRAVRDARDRGGL